MLEKPLTVRDLIEPAIMKAGGWVNTHAHADRAFTLSDKVLEIRRTYTLQQKWDVLPSRIITAGSASSLN